MEGKLYGIETSPNGLSLVGSIAMNVNIRIPRPVFEIARTDLAREHSFAAERIGFLSGRIGDAKNEGLIILLNRYLAIPDEDYVDDPGSGARIDGTAIRRVMQHVLDTGESMFHLHVHAHRGKPVFSHMDRTEIPRLIESFKAVGPTIPHGMMLFSRDTVHAEVAVSRQSQVATASKISIIGFPLSFL
jgi:hypothetical protein